MKDKVVHEWECKGGHKYLLKKSPAGHYCRYRVGMEWNPYVSVEKEPHGQDVYNELARLAERVKELEAISRNLAKYLAGHLGYDDCPPDVECDDDDHDCVACWLKWGKEGL
jgi:hypothetical protein